MIPRRPVEAQAPPPYPTQAGLLTDRREHGRALAIVAAAALVLNGCQIPWRNTTKGHPPAPQPPVKPGDTLMGEMEAPKPVEPRLQLSGLVIRIEPPDRPAKDPAGTPSTR